MDNVALLRDQERQELFTATASARGVHPAVIEKDFWVCWVLKKLFESTDLASHLVFKGGTSLSKVHGLIDRFSEDIDLVLDWGLLGYGKDGLDPWAEQPSRTKLDQFNQEFNAKAGAYIQTTLCPQVSELLSMRPGIRVAVSTDEPQVVNVAYPAAFELSALRPEVRLEIGPLASWVPKDTYTITPYAAENFPSVFKSPTCSVVAITAERTFWEKATILHQQAHRKHDSVMPDGYSRHYYDLFRMSQATVKTNALADSKLLRDVVTFKERFYRSPWARYELAKPGSFKLIPAPVHNQQLQKDYDAMQPMFFSPPPGWPVIQAALAELEHEINSLPAG